MTKEYKRNNYRHSLLCLLLCVLSLTSYAGHKLQETASGIKYRIIRKGSGTKPLRGDRVNVFYVSQLMTDTLINKYDSITGPATFVLGEGEVLKGIDEIVSMLKPGGKIYAELPPQMAYGNRKLGKIPAGSSVKVDLELLGYSPAFYKPLYNDTVVLRQGVRKLVAKEGSGDLPKVTNNVTLTFTGYYITDRGERKIFDKSAPGQFLTFQLGGSEMIPGLDYGLRTMRQGERATFIISPALAYKNEKRGELPPNTTIYLDVQMVSYYDPFLQVAIADTMTTASGLKYIAVRKGDGKKPGRNGVVAVKFIGYIIDTAGNRIIFDKLTDDKPWRYRVGSKNILPGLNEGIAEMSKGAQFRLIIPPQLAFADRQIGIISPNSTVYYDILLEDITPMTFLTKAGMDTLTLRSGLKILPVNDVPKGVLADSNATVYAKFMGYYIDSLGLPVIFQSTVEEGKPYEFQLGRNDLIKGMKEALSQLHEGQVAKLFIPSALAYGTAGVSGLIPKNVDLIFDIQILKVINDTTGNKNPVEEDKSKIK